MIGSTLGRYRLHEQLGAGGMGVVYRAWDDRLEREVALKVLPPGTAVDETTRKRFRKEALALSRLNHPNIATIHDFDSVDEVDFIVMEVITGRNIDNLTTGLTEQEVLKLGLQLAQGLAAAHSAGVLHHDLKPANLRLTPDGRLKILDFGLARLHKGLETFQSETVPLADRVAGTLPYMAPEQLRGNEVDERTDIYGCGAVLYELLTGRRPFQESNSARLIENILKGEPRPPTELNDGISSALEQIVLKALDKDPERRYQSAKELAVDLARLAGSTDSVRSLPQPRSARRRLVASGAVAVLAVLILAGVASRRIRDGVSGLFSPPRIEKVAVLALANESGDPDQTYLADGITRDLISQLGRIPSIRVTSLFSAAQYRKGKKTLPEIARELGVTRVVQGSVARGPDRVRIALELSDAATGQKLWSRSYEPDLRGLVAEETRMVKDIVDEIGVRAGTPHIERAVRPEAHEAFLKGVYENLQGNAGKAKEQFENATKLDPTFAPAWAALANAYVNVGWFEQTIPPMQAYPRAKELAMKALSLDDTSEAHAALAAVRLHHEWDWDGAEAEFKRALELSPSNATAHHLYAHHLLTVGRLEESVAETRKASDLDPLNPRFASCVGWHCLFARQYSEAVAQCLNVINDKRAVGVTYYYLGRAYGQMGKHAEAIAALQTAVEKSGAPNPMLATLGYALARGGKREEALQVLGKLEERAKSRYVAAIDFAVLYAGLGDADHAFDWLDKAYLERSTWLVHIQWDDRFADLRSDPRFAALVRRIGLPQTSSQKPSQRAALN